MTTAMQRHEPGAAPRPPSPESPGAGPPGPVDPRSARRRLVSYARLEDLLADLDAVERAHRDGRLRRLGNHDAAPIFAHLGMAVRGCFDGFPTFAPLWLRLLGRLLKARVLSAPFQPGLRLSPKNQALAWPPAPPFDAALADLRAELARLRAAREDKGPRPAAPHPFFGPMTPDEWQRYHLRHAELHMSFLAI